MAREQFLRSMVRPVTPPASATKRSKSKLRALLSGLRVADAEPAGQPVPPYAGFPREMPSANADVVPMRARIVANKDMDAVFIFSPFLLEIPTYPDSPRSKADAIANWFRGELDWKRGANAGQPVRIDSE